mgnify:CR=1 FL=1
MNLNKKESEHKTVPERNTFREFLLGRRGAQTLTGYAMESESVSLAGPRPAGHQIKADRVFRQQVKEQTAAAKRFGLLAVKTDQLPEHATPQDPEARVRRAETLAGVVKQICTHEKGICCLLYTSDAADDAMNV